MRWLTRLFRRRKLDAQLDSELRFHVEQQTADNIAAGMSPAEARRRALAQFGGLEYIREETRDARGTQFLESLFQDVRFALRMLRKSPGFTTVAVLTLALGIGATTVMYSVIDSIFWKPLPFPQSERLALVESSNLKQTWNYGPVSAADYLDWKAQSTVFDELAAFDWGGVRTLTGTGLPERVHVMSVSTNFLQTLQIAPALGGNFRPDENETGTNHVAILTGSFWQERFHSDSGLIGRAIILDGQSYTVVGVCPPAFHLQFADDPDVYVPLTLDLAAAAHRADRALMVFGRMKSGMNLAGVKATMTPIAERLARQYPKQDRDWGVRVENLRYAFTHFESATIFSYFLLGAVTLILLIACANVANLLLSRGLSRQGEFALRAALGASRVVLVRQLLIESVVVAAAAGVTGTLLAVWGVRAFSAFLPPGILPRQDYIAFASSALFFAMGLSFATAMLFGFAPALFSSDVDLNSCLKEGHRTAIGGADQSRMRNLAVVAQTAIAFVLLFSAGLFVNSFLRLERVSLGFNPRNILTLQLRLSGPQYSSHEKVILFYDNLLRRVRSLPGIKAAVAASQTPLTGGMAIRVVVKGSATRDPHEETKAATMSRVVTTNYFHVMGIPLVAGRDFNDRDIAAAPRVAIVNENFVRHFLSGQNPLGQRLEILSGGYDKFTERGEVEIVGVVGNVKEVGLNEVAFNDIYLPFTQSPDPSMYLAVSTALPLARIVDSIRQQVLSLDADIPLLSVISMDQRVSNALRGDRFNLFLIAGFAFMAILLASIGVFGVVSYSVGKRTQEFGIRIALGADRGSILSLVLRSATALSATGVMVGVMASLALARILGDRLYLVPREHDGLLYKVSLFDPLTLSAAFVLLTSIALLATYIPARRAMRVDPMVALRYE